VDAVTETERQLVLQRALDGEIDAAAIPAELQDELAGVRRVVAALRALPEAELPDGFARRLRRRLELASSEAESPAGPRTPRPLARRALPWAVGAVAAALLLAVVGRGVATVERPKGQVAASVAAARVAGPVHAPAVGAAAAPAASFAAAQPGAPAAGAAATNAPDVSGQAAGIPDLSQRKIVENVSMTVEVADVGGAFDRIGALATQAGGYVAGSDLSRQDGSLHASVTARVPAGAVAGFTQSVAALGTVTAQGQSSSDVTQQYIDLNGRLTALQAERSAYLALLQRATNVADALKVQQALTDVQAQIESLTAEIQSLDRLSSLATVNVTLQPLSSTPSLAGNGGPFSHRLSAALANSWRALAAAAAAVAVAVVWALPWLVILAAAGAAVMGIRRRLRPRPPSV
jgi:hypothetical protein